MERWIYVVIVGILGLIGWAIWGDATAEKFSLRKDSFVCTASHQETQIILQSFDGGKTQMPMPIINTICDQWTRNR